MDREFVERKFQELPKLELFIGAGTISLRMARDILGIDRYAMYSLFKDLLLAGAVTACSGSTFRATPELRAFLDERRK